MMNWTTLVQADELAAALEQPDLRLVDARFALMDPSSGRRDYLASHLPGAVHADLNADLSDLRKTGAGRHPLPESDAFARKLGEWGIGTEHQVVVYDGGDGSMAAARFWWMLKLLGHERVAVLDGGLAAWRAKRLPETVQPAQPAPLEPYPARFDTRRIADADEILARLDEDSGWLFDARAPERFRGEVEPIDPVAGHVPGALNRPYTENLRDGRFQPRDALRQALLPQLAGREVSDTVLMCGSGVTACHLLLAFEHAGLHGARVYAGSWSGWISDPSRPIAQGS
jgi:thiosulfate/3-mercaptopyruvate sulfurtransferase